MDGELVDAASTPRLATQLGIAIVHQHPAVLPDLTVAENIRVAVPRDVPQVAGTSDAAMRQMLDDVGSTAHLEDRVGLADASPRSTCSSWPRRSSSSRSCSSSTSPPRRSARTPSTCSSSGCARPPRGHRRRLHHPPPRPRCASSPHRVTVLRDGKLRGTADVDDITDDELLATHRRPRSWSRRFPPKLPPRRADDDAGAASSTASPGTASPTSRFDGTPRRDRRRRRHRRQRPERAAARARPASSRSRASSRSAARTSAAGSCASARPTCPPTGTARA